MKGILKSIGFFLLYIIMTMLFQMLGSACLMGIAAAKGYKDEQFLIEFANNNILGITVISGVFTVLTFFLIFKIRKADIRKEWKLRKTDNILLILSVIVCFSYSLLFSLLTYETSFENSLMIYHSADYYSGIIPHFGVIMTALNLIVIAPIAEETVLRGIIFTRTETTAGPFAAIAVSSLLFGLMHLMAGGILLVLGAFLMGAVLGFVFYKTNSLPACFIAHAAANLPDLIFYPHPQISGGLTVVLEIIFAIIFAASVFLLFKRKRFTDNLM